MNSYRCCVDRCVGGVVVVSMGVPELRRHRQWLRRGPGDSVTDHRAVVFLPGFGMSGVLCQRGFPYGNRLNAS